MRNRLVRYLSSLVTFLLMGVLVLFASSNHEETKLELFPLPQEITAPLYLIAFLMIFSGFVLGGLAAWNAGRRHRRSAKQAQKRIQILEGDLISMRSRAEAAEERAAQLASGTRAESLSAPLVDNPELL